MIMKVYMVIKSVAEDTCMISLFSSMNKALDFIESYIVDKGYTEQYRSNFDGTYAMTAIDEKTNDKVCLYAKPFKVY